MVKFEIDVLILDLTKITALNIIYKLGSRLICARIKRAKTFIASHTHRKHQGVN